MVEKLLLGFDIANKQLLIEMFRFLLYNYIKQFYGGVRLTDYILKDWDGNLFISMTNEDEITLSQYEQLTHCLAVVKVDEDS